MTVPTASMDLPFPTFPSLFTFFLPFSTLPSMFTFFLPFLFFFFFFFFFLTKSLKNKSSSTPNLPPGPWKLPLIGNLHQLLGSSLPHRSLANLAKKYGPLMHLKLGEVDMVVVSSPETAKEIMKTHDIIFARRPHRLAPSIITYNCTDIVFSPYGSYWRQLRKICTMELLSSKRVQSFRSIREEEVSNLVKNIRMHGISLPINLSGKIDMLTLRLISRVAVGDKCGDQELFVSAIMEFLSLASSFSFAEMFPSIKMLEQISGLRPKLEKLHQQVDRIIENIINEHKRGARNNPDNEEDLVAVLLRLQEHGNLEFPLSEDTIKAIILDVFTAGSETSASTIEWVMTELLRNPALMKKAQAEVRKIFDKRRTVDESGIHELKFLKLVIRETLRLHPPVSLIPRECGTDCRINGYDIPAKMKIFINTWAIARDSSCWNEPESFNPDRFLDSDIDFKGTDYKYIPFGSGRRICPGTILAMANIELPLAQLLYHFDWQLPHGLKPEDIDTTEANGLTISKKEDLYLIPIPYQP